MINRRLIHISSKLSARCFEADLSAYDPLFEERPDRLLVSLTLKRTESELRRSAMGAPFPKWDFDNL